MAAHCDDTAHLLPVSARRDHRQSWSTPIAWPRRFRGRSTGRLWRTGLSQHWNAIRAPRRSSERDRAALPWILRANGGTEDPRSASQDRHSLMSWIADQFFQDAKTEGWFDAILVQARIHPRAIRTMEYADHCDEVWSSAMPEPYPPFEDWRREADAFVDLDD